MLCRKVAFHMPAFECSQW